MRITNDRVIYKDLSYRLNGIFFKVHNELGRFCREKQYGDLIENYLKKLGISYNREFEISNYNTSEKPIGGNRVDFLIENKIIIELKVERFITRHNYIQTQRYLRAVNLKLGIIVNFNQKYLTPKRVLNSQAKE